MCGFMLCVCVRESVHSTLNLISTSKSAAPSNPLSNYLPHTYTRTHIHIHIHTHTRTRGTVRVN